MCNLSLNSQRSDLVSNDPLEADKYLWGGCSFGFPTFDAATEYCPNNSPIVNYAKRVDSEADTSVGPACSSHLCSKLINNFVKA